MEFLNKINLDEQSIDECFEFLEHELSQSTQGEAETLADVMKSIPNCRAIENVTQKAIAESMLRIIHRDTPEAVMQRLASTAFLAGVIWLYLHEKQAGETMAACMATANLPRA